MKLTKNFSLEEMTHSITASNHGIDNTPNAEARAALKRLCVEVLQPIRDAWGKPIKVTSGYRCTRLNTMVGGVRNSQHVLGQAADIQATAYADNVKLFRCIERLVKAGKIKTGQVIWEYGTKANPKWVHVSLPRVGKPNNQFLYYYS